ncbi:hypothetical protein O6H91_01G022400 [Diphasiastrum complanatum]|uniref:Uncharacterized protein n=1 Tax=Diphasiastrum complanatum TaxID=34168 RepID=A0ACC2ENY3_DIPCM|nr:hypothetical protein O6H91_01G022400 [Diphasiastrum complanatum]
MGITPGMLILLATATLMLGSYKVLALDPPPLEDFHVPTGIDPKTATAENFTFRGLGVVTPPVAGEFVIAAVSFENFSILKGGSVSAALFNYGPGSVNGLHNHPRASELLYVLSGRLDVGVVDTTNKLFNTTLGAGEIFFFPQGLPHYQSNPSTTDAAAALASFSSSNPGLVLAAPSLFRSGIPTDVLVKTFGVSEITISQLKTPYRPHF